MCYVNISIHISGNNGSCPGLYGGLYRQNLPYKFKNSYSGFRNHNFKIHIELLAPVRSETGSVILGKFWSRFDLRQRRNRKFLGDDQAGNPMYCSVRTAFLKSARRGRPKTVVKTKIGQDLFINNFILNNNTVTEL